MTAVLLALIVLLLSLTRPQPGECGVQHTVYSKEADDVNVPCENVANPDCSTTTWLYRRPGSTNTVEEVSHGKIKSEVQETNRADRLRLEPNCSLKILNVSSQDAGEYRCRQYLKEHGPQHGNDAVVYLNVLAVSSSIPAPKLKANATVTFYCHLATDDCAKYQNDIAVRWTGFELHQVKEASACNISVTVLLMKGDNNRKLKCNVKWRGKLKASVDYTIYLQGQDGPDFVCVVVAVAGTLAVALLVFLIVLWRRKAKWQTACVRSLNVSTTVTKEKTEDERKPQEVLTDQGVTYAEINITANTHKISDKPAARQETEYASIKTTCGTGNI